MAKSVSCFFCDKILLGALKFTQRVKSGTLFRQGFVIVHAGPFGAVELKSRIFAPISKEHPHNWIVRFENTNHIFLPRFKAVVKFEQNAIFTILICDPRRY